MNANKSLETLHLNACTIKTDVLLLRYSCCKHVSSLTNLNCSALKRKMTVYANTAVAPRVALLRMQ